MLLQGSHIAEQKKLLVKTYRRLRGTSCHLAATMKKMTSRRDDEEDVISGRLIFHTFQMHVTLHRIDRFLSQIKPLIFYFNLR